MPLRRKITFLPGEPGVCLTPLGSISTGISLPPGVKLTKNFATLNEPAIRFVIAWPCRAP